MPRKITTPRVARKATSTARQTAEYRHKEETPARPDVGTQPQFKKRAAPKTYRYDSSFAPALDWDSQNPAREKAEALIAQIEWHVSALRARVAKLPAAAGKESPALYPLGKGSKSASAKGAKGEGNLLSELQAELQSAEEALKKLKALSKPFLNWAGKAERLSFDVPTLPLFVHERLSTRAILETKGFDELEEVKREAAERWVRAVNAEGSFGDWHYAIAKQVSEVPKLISVTAGV